MSEKIKTIAQIIEECKEGGYYYGLKIGVQPIPFPLNQKYNRWEYDKQLPIALKLKKTILKDIKNNEQYNIEDKLQNFARGIIDGRNRLESTPNYLDPRKGVARVPYACECCKAHKRCYTVTKSIGIDGAQNLYTLK